MRYKPPAINDIGVEKHLNATAQEHNGFGFSEFKRMYDTHVNTSNIARAFKVNRNTVTKWAVAYEKELAKE